LFLLFYFLWKSFKQNRIWHKILKENIRKVYTGYYVYEAKYKKKEIKPYEYLYLSNCKYGNCSVGSGNCLNCHNFCAHDKHKDIVYCYINKKERNKIKGDE